ncbi:ABC transporter ATP-binding protein [Aliidiomarina taiwanensis]|uniref:ATP-binding protein Uup n=1 Tax=Aliidiomarina taiwanensis TaxID=946228 RepID=A0A432XA12_9GAMM|nr:ATP-binding cassette domain-containing protein [Aliidiomarina taiwanensis]RUO44150.1 ABC transporter ATP-binding protein [Aliidiomarina taiwanensis]
MSLLRLQNARLAFGTAPVLDNTQLIVERDERLCIVGRNGAGKSSLLKVLNGQVALDDGELKKDAGLKVAMLPQDPPARTEMAVFDFVAGAFADLKEHLSQYARLIQRMTDEPTNEALFTELSKVQEVLEAQNGWEVQQQIEQTLTRLGLDGQARLDSLSGGWLRRVALAKAWVIQPDVLLLDEPTNHLDVETVQWLEQTLRDFHGSIVFISHDRAFIRALATRIVDLDRGELHSFPGNYDAYLVEKQRLLEVEEAHNAAFDKKLAEEEVWIRQGIKARRTRNEGRVRALKALREERKQRREKQSTANFEAQAAERSGKIVWRANNISFQYNDKVLVKDFTFTLQRGDKIAIVGPNGIGKSTLIKLILGDLQPTAGTMEQGTKLNVAYYDQHRAELDPEKSIADNVGEGKMDVTFGGRTRHIYSYLQDFLFTPQQARMPVKALSGGERNRVLLAQILLKECNLLILDEPTNDLDVETLELLETIVSEFKGTVLLVSHDREFIENTANEVLLFEGNGQITEIVGGFHEVAMYQQAKREKEQKRAVNTPKQGTSAKEKHSQAQQTSARSGNKLSYKLKRELEQLPAKIEQLEQELEGLQEKVSEPDFFTQPIGDTQPVLERIQAIEEELETALERWDYLENFEDN